MAGSRGREGRENMAVESKVGWGKLGRSNLIKYPSGIRVNPILEEINPLVHCDIPPKSIRSEPKRKGEMVTSEV